ncbi:hypothetical protein A3770_02p16130 [Chloropicon primus]|uniref:Uncharacterized protein n=1 Tax=Chloropicon primus TaxID=1764295 RepID=A0A5B8MHG8_9CHLO|nr:hypothetical protein A3770_02p16130 [Chloropicon primus]|eukprot:QDZ19095.1 hypothetical protein A3770_02p16130 [Chloropicon primus]
MTQAESISVEFGVWQTGTEEPATPVLVRMKSVESPATTVLVEGSGSSSGKTKRGAALLANVTNTLNEGVASGANEVWSKKSTRSRRRTKVMNRLRGELSQHQESFAQAEKIAQEAEKMASEVVTQSQIQLALMEEALEDAVAAENEAVQGWQMSEDSVQQLLGVLREREKRWARAMWKYACNAVLRARSGEGEEERPARGARGGGTGSRKASDLAGNERGRSRTRKAIGSPPLTEENVGKLKRRQIRNQKREMLEMLDRFIASLPLEE